MILDTVKAYSLLSAANMSAPTMSMVANGDALKEQLFLRLVNLRFEDGYDERVDEDLDEEIHDFAYGVKFEMKDVNFCLVHDKDHWQGPTTTLYVSLRCDDSWDQHMEVVGVDDTDSDWSCSMEQAWDYKGDKDIPTLRAELEAMGGTYDKELESYFVEEA